MGVEKIMASNIRGRKKLLHFEVWSAMAADRHAGYLLAAREDKSQ